MTQPRLPRFALARRLVGALRARLPSAMALDESYLAAALDAIDLERRQRELDACSRRQFEPLRFGLGLR